MTEMKRHNHPQWQLILGLAAATIVASPGAARAELWKCTPTAGGTPYYTETPSFGDDVSCEEVNAAKYSKPGGGNDEKQARKPASERPKLLKKNPAGPKSKKPAAAKPKPTPKPKPKSPISSGRSKK